MNDQLMLEYIFFHEEPCRRFKDFLLQKGVAPLKEGLDETDVEGLTVFIRDDLDEDLSDEIEAFYDEMMTLNEALVAETEDSELHKVGLAVSLRDGRSVYAAVDPEVLARVLTVISHDELGKIVAAVADAVENPDERPLCKR
jgi:hypothetical protein